MTGSHDPADCELAVCHRCDSYGDGYSAGKDAAYFAISTWEPDLSDQIDYNDPRYAQAAAEILRRHDGGEPEANITSAVRDFPYPHGPRQGR